MVLPILLGWGMAIGCSSATSDGESTAGSGAGSGGSDPSEHGASGSAGQSPEVDAPAELPPLCETTLTEEGPSGYAWCLYADSGSSARWAEDPTAEAAQATVDGGQYSTGGMVARLSTTGTVDLSEYDKIVIEAEVADGLMFEVWVGHDQIGCSYVLTGEGDTTYTVDLSDPDWCVPTLCEYDLHANGVAVNSEWDHQGEIELIVKSLSFETSSGGAGTVRAREAAIGPGGYCWFITAWDANSTVSWVQPPNAESAHAVATSGADAGAVLAVELEGRPVDLTEFSTAEFDAIVTADPIFHAQFVSDAPEPAGCTWDIIPENGLATYTLDLSSPDNCFGSPKFDLTTAVRMDFGTGWVGESSMDIEVFEVRFVE
jgi:hypothetical protein